MEGWGVGWIHFGLIRFDIDSLDIAAAPLLGVSVDAMCDDGPFWFSPCWDYIQKPSKLLRRLRHYCLSTYITASAQQLDWLSKRPRPRSRSAARRRRKPIKKRRVSITSNRKKKPLVQQNKERKNKKQQRANSRSRTSQYSASAPPPPRSHPP